MDRLWGSIEAEYSRQAEWEVWGHLAPEPNRIYNGVIVFTYTAWGQFELIQTEFKGLDMSPWFVTHMQDFVYDNCPREVGVYKFEGTYIWVVDKLENPEDFNPDLDDEPELDCEYFFNGNITPLMAFLAN